MFGLVQTARLMLMPYSKVCFCAGHQSLGMLVRLVCGGEAFGHGVCLHSLPSIHCTQSECFIILSLSTVGAKQTALSRSLARCNHNSQIMNESRARARSLLQTKRISCGQRTHILRTGVMRFIYCATCTLIEKVKWPLQNRALNWSDHYFFICCWLVYGERCAPLH